MMQTVGSLEGSSTSFPPHSGHIGQLWEAIVSLDKVDAINSGMDAIVAAITGKVTQNLPPGTHNDQLIQRLPLDTHRDEFIENTILSYKDHISEPAQPSKAIEVEGFGQKLSHAAVNYQIEEAPFRAWRNSRTQHESTSFRY
jgi:hypothetical protein